MGVEERDGIGRRAAGDVDPADSLKDPILAGDENLKEIQQWVGTESSRIERAASERFLPEKGGFPEISSKSTAPRAKMSVLASAVFPSSCSGAMYW